MAMRESFTFFRLNFFLSHTAEKVRKGILLCFDKI